MNDKELLELAAKAAGLPECGWMGPAFMYVNDNTFTDWNPLTDDGDALRLAVKLAFKVVCTNEGNAYVWRENGELLWNEIVLHEWVNDQRTAAIRRAIVRAAAEIGKAMP